MYSVVTRFFSLQHEQGSGAQSNPGKSAAEPPAGESRGGPAAGRFSIAEVVIPRSASGIPA